MSKYAKSSRRAARVFVYGALAGLIAASSTARAETAKEFYTGKQIELIIPDGPGGGYDVYYRLLAYYLADHIPGHPAIVDQNMPGAAGLVATNYLYKNAPKDGTVLGSTYNTLLTEPLFGDPAAKYDPTKFEWVGSINTQYNACMVWHTSPIKTIQDAMKHVVKVSAAGFSGNSAKTPLLLNTLIGTKFQVIGGYTTSGMRLAVERGEVQGICGFSYDTYQAANPEWLKDHKIRFILQMGPKKIKELPNVPSLTDFVKNPKDMAALKLIDVDEDVGRPIMFPPGVPQYLLDSMRQAFNETMKDPKFLAAAHRMHIDPHRLSGAVAENEIKAAYASPKDVVALAAKLWPPALHAAKQKKKVAGNAN